MVTDMVLSIEAQGRFFSGAFSRLNLQVTDLAEAFWVGVGGALEMQLLLVDVKSGSTYESSAIINHICL